MIILQCTHVKARPQQRRNAFSCRTRTGKRCRIRHIIHDSRASYDEIIVLRRLIQRGVYDQCNISIPYRIFDVWTTFMYFSIRFGFYPMLCEKIPRPLRCNNGETGLY